MSQEVDYLHPELLPAKKLRKLLKKRYIQHPDLKNLDHSSLLELYYKTLLPYPQREYRKNRQGKLLTRKRKKTESAKYPDIGEPPKKKLKEHSEKKHFSVEQSSHGECTHKKQASHKEQSHKEHKHKRDNTDDSLKKGSSGDRIKHPPSFHGDSRKSKQKSPDSDYKKDCKEEKSSKSKHSGDSQSSSKQSSDDESSHKRKHKRITWP